MLLAIMPPPEPAPLWEIVPVPAAYQACPLPAGWGGRIPDSGPVSRASNSISVADGVLSWNGVPIDDRVLREYLRAVGTLKPRPLTIVHVQGMSCDRLRAITDLVQAEAPCSPDLCVFSVTPPPNAVVAPAPPPPPSPTPGTRVQPISPGAWVTNDDYPPAAIRGGQQGTTSFRLDIDGKGMVTECTVTGSSGSQLLDDATCVLLKTRARFQPALDAQGRPIDAVYSNRFRWELPQQPPQPMASWTAILRITIGNGGEVVSCSQQAFGPVPDGAKPGCDWLASATRDETRNMRGSATGPVTILMRADHLVSGMPAPSVPALAAAFKAIWGMKLRREIGPDGYPSACYVDWGQGEAALPAGRCMTLGRYVAGPEQHSIVSANAVLTDGDPNVGDALNLLTAHLPK